ncbi:MULTISPECIES: hypothetical protein [unclassified Streptomyces]|uniref:hypothetical protein n=1 Tax=unclassified Streptomyces TaxID=2593676 RepID=UPI0033FCA346
MRRSTPLTRASGTFALMCAAVAVLLVWFRYGAPTPRIDVLTAIGLALASGLVWVVATRRAPYAGTQAEPVGQPASGAPEIPSVIPRPGLVRIGPGIAAMLGLLALIPAAILGQLPDGEQQRTIRALQEAGARVATGAVVSVDSEEHSGVGYGSRRSGGSYYFVSMKVKVHEGAVLDVDRGITASSPSADQEVAVLYAPGRPELGGWVDESDDVRAFVPGWRLRLPPSGPVPLLGLSLVCLLFVGAAGQLGSRGQRRVLIEDSAAGQVHAMRVERLEAVLETHTTVGSRAGSVVEKVRTRLRVTGAAGSIDLADVEGETLGHGREFSVGGGWVCVARRWTMVKDKHPLPVVYVADDGRMFWATTRTWEVRLHSSPGGFEEHATRPDTQGRLFHGFCGTTPGARLALVGVHALLAVALLPVLTGHTTHLVGWLTTVPAVVAAVIATPIVLNRARGRLRREEGWVRTSTRDARVPD